MNPRVSRLPDSSNVITGNSRYGGKILYCSSTAINKDAFTNIALSISMFAECGAGSVYPPGVHEFIPCSTMTTQCN